MALSSSVASGMGNIMAALGQSNRISQVFLSGLTDRQLVEVSAPMQTPFPELTELRLFSYGETLSIIPDSFLDRSAPRLRLVDFFGIPLPGLPKLLLSATHLVHLTLFNIPHSGYFLPEAVVTLISMLSRLEVLSLEFQSPRSRPNSESRRLPPSKRSVIPALDHFRFKGAIEYLEDVVAFIDAPQLNHFFITFFNQINFDTPQLAHFINRTPELRGGDARVQFDDDFARVGFPTSSGSLEISISCREQDWQLSSIEQVCGFSLQSLSTVENLYIEHQYGRLVWKNDAIENTLWLHLLFPFTAVKNLYLSKEFAPGILAAMGELVGVRIMEVLPGLQDIFVEGLQRSQPQPRPLRRFVAARHLSGHPITIAGWGKLDVHKNPMWNAALNAARKSHVTARTFLRSHSSCICSCTSGTRVPPGHG